MIIGIEKGLYHVKQAICFLNTKVLGRAFSNHPVETFFRPD